MTFLGVKDNFSYIKQVPLNPTLIFELYQFSFGERLLFAVGGGLIFSQPFRFPCYYCFCKTSYYCKSAEILLKY